MGNKEDSYRLGPKYLCVGQEALEAVCHVWMSGRPNTILMIFIMELMILGVMSRQLCLIKLILRCLPWFLLLQISMLSKIYVGCLNFIRTIQPGHYAFCRRSVKIWSSLQCHTFICTYFVWPNFVVITPHHIPQYPVWAEVMSMEGLWKYCLFSDKFG